ncbi:MAG: hypothetical protein H7Z71_07785 [Moraxellaceae bacterium]|nr:hypothetical protein [Pseudobdellovibrionaceae bacterium]
MKNLGLMLTIFLGSVAWSQTRVNEIPQSFAGKYQFVDSYYRTAPSKCPQEIQIVVTTQAGRTTNINARAQGPEKQLNKAMSLTMAPDKTLQSPLNEKKLYVRTTSQMSYFSNLDYPELSYFEVGEKKTTLKKYLLMDVTQDEYANTLQFIMNKNQSSTLSIKIFERAIGNDQQMEMCNYLKP